MKFFIDTANLDQIREAHDLGVLDGVTTNPSLMAKEGIKGVENQRRHYVEICNIVQGDVSAEVIATDYEGMVREGKELAALNPHIVVKVPCIADGIKAIKHFSGKASVPIAHWFSPLVRLYWLLKRELRMFLLSWDVWMTSVRMELDWLPISFGCTASTIILLRCWPPLSVVPSTSWNVWRPVPM